MLKEKKLSTPYACQTMTQVASLNVSSTERVLIRDVFSHANVVSMNSKLVQISTHVIFQELHLRVAVVFEILHDLCPLAFFESVGLQLICQIGSHALAKSPCQFLQEDGWED